MQSAVRDLAGSQRPASSKVREALGEMQQRELGLRMRYLSEWISRGLGAYAWLREAAGHRGNEPPGRAIAPRRKRLLDRSRKARRILRPPSPAWSGFAIRWSR